MRAPIFLALTLLSALGGCGIFDSKTPKIVRQERMGEKTEEQLKTLPKGLVADDANQSHSYETLRGDGN